MHMREWIFPAKRKAIHLPKTQSQTKTQSQQVREVGMQLEKWRDQRVFMSVHVPSMEEVFQSMVLAVDVDEGLFLIDALFPRYDGQLLLNKTLGLESRESHARSFLSSTCVGLGREQDQFQNGKWHGQTLVMRMPDKSLASPRRQYFRVNLAPVKDAWVQLLDIQFGEKEVCLPIENISSRGLAIQAPLEVAENFKMIGRGSAFVSVLDRMFEAQVSVRHFSPIAQDKALIGLEFCDLTAYKITRLEQWVNRLQRQVLQIDNQAA